MKSKFYYAVFIACFLVINSFAQKKQNVYFLKDNGKYVTERDSADYTRIVQEPDSGSKLYNVVEYYPNGNPKMIAKSSAVDLIKLEGQTISFYQNKNKNVWQIMRTDDYQAAFMIIFLTGKFIVW